MPHKFGLLVILMIAIAGCSSEPSSMDIQTAIAETSQSQPVSTNTTIVRTATPSSTPFPTETPIPIATLIPTETSIPTPTKVPLSDLDLESILFRSGDLPPNIIPGQISTNLETPQDPFPEPQFAIGNPSNRISLDLHYLDAPQKGSVKILVYETAEEAISLYEQLAIDMEENIAFYDSDFTMAERGVAGYDGSMTSFLNLISGRNDKGTELQQTVFLRCNTVVRVFLILDSRDDSAKVYAQRLDDRLMDLVCPNISQAEN